MREIGYYWVSLESVEDSSWRVAYWDGKLFHIAGATYPYVSLNPLHVDERRIVRGHQRRLRQPSQRDIDMTASVLAGDKMRDVAKRHGITPTRVRGIVWRTLHKRNPTLYRKLTPTDPHLLTPTVFQIRKHAAEFGFAVGDVEATS